MTETKILHVPLFGGTDVGYRMPCPYDPSKPTLVMLHSFTTTSELYSHQYEDREVTDAMNLLAIEILGHGLTRSKTPSWTYWDCAAMNLQVLDALGIKKAFLLGTSQGGWVTIRMALLAPDRVEGLIPLGSSMDYESERTRLLNCWDAPLFLGALIDDWSSTTATPDFVPAKEYCDFLVDIGFGKGCDPAVRAFWSRTIIQSYLGNDGRLRLRMAAINLRDRDGLHGRLYDITCPVMWLHGTADVVYSVTNAREEIKLFQNALHAELVTVKKGAHFLSASSPKEVNRALVDFVPKWANKHIP